MKEKEGISMRMYMRRKMRRRTDRKLIIETANPLLRQLSQGE